MKFHATSFGMPSPAHAASEDAFAVTNRNDGNLLCVLSDGVSAARDPRRCAERVVRLVSDNFEARPREWPPRKTFERLIDEVNSSLYREGAYMDGVPSMQATLAAVFLSGSKLAGINVGDSPVLLVRGKTVERLTVTQSRQNADGQDVLTGAMGMGQALAPHYFEKELHEGDIVVITSDGLTNLLEDEEIADAARRFGSARTMIQEAAKFSEPQKLDDLSAIIVEVKEISPQTQDFPSQKNVPFPTLEKGAIVDGYKLQRPLAGNDRVWLAEKEQSRFVLKFLPHDADGDETGTIRARFAREAWNACRFGSEYFVPALLPESGSPHYYIMEYAEAPSLSLLLKTRRLSADETVNLGRFLVHACQRLLRHELIHGDIKSDNVLIFRTGDDFGFKLLDLGLASAVFTDTGRAGTPSYLAPERFSGAVVTERTEIFAIGATLYEMLTGRLPFGEIERFQEPRFRAPRRPSHWNPNVPAWLDAVILKCIMRNPAQRFQHYSELLFALEHPDAAPTDAFEAEPLLARNPLLFFKIGFFVLLATCVVLLLKIISMSGRP